MTCADAESLICDYATLSSADRFELERHLGECHPCAELARDAVAGAEFLRRAEPVEAPPELVNRILFDAPWVRRKSKARTWLDVLFTPIRQPRFAMSMAMTIVSFAMLARFVVPVRTIRPEDLKPAAVWAGLEDRAYRTWGRALKFYDNLKVVYDIQATLKEWQQRTEDQPVAAAPSDRIEDRRLPVHALPHSQVGGQKIDDPGGAPPDHAPEKQN